MLNTNCIHDTWLGLDRYFGIVTRYEDISEQLLDTRNPIFLAVVCMYVHTQIHTYISKYMHICTYACTHAEHKFHPF